MVEVNFRVSNYLPRDSAPLPRPTEGAVAGILQVVLESGRVGTYRINATIPGDIPGEKGGPRPLALCWLEG